MLEGLWMLRVEIERMPYIDFVDLIVDKLVAGRSISQAKNGVVCDSYRLLAFYCLFALNPVS